MRKNPDDSLPLGASAVSALPTQPGTSAQQTSVSDVLKENLTAPFRITTTGLTENESVSRGEVAVMKHNRVVATLLGALLSAFPVHGTAADRDKKEGANPVQWVEMPAGARQAYIGIHGGTVPVSLLTAGDGSPMIARVGLTGSDFLHFLRSGGRPDNEVVLFDITEKAETVPPPPAAPLLPSKNATVLLAGTAAGDVPVIYATGRTFENMSLIPANWAPFGLTQKPLSAEGAVKVTLPQPRKQRRASRS